MITDKETADRLRSLMDERHWTPRQMGEAIGYSASPVRVWLRAAGYPSTEAICRICDTLGILPDYLTGYSDKPTPTREKSKRDEIGRRIKRAMNRQGMSASMLADETGYYYDTVYRWLGGKRIISSSALLVVCEVLETTPSYILGYTEQMRRRKT